MKDTKLNQMMRLFYLLLLMITLVSCTFNQTFSNRKSDKEAAEKVTQKFYWELKHGEDINDLYSLLGKEFYTKTSKHEFTRLNDLFNEKLGKVEEYTLDKWETLVIINSKKTDGNYVLSYKVKRVKKKDITETITLKMEKGKIKIVGYNVDVNLLELVD